MGRLDSDRITARQRPRGSLRDERAGAGGRVDEHPACAMPIATGRGVA